MKIVTSIVGFPEYKGEDADHADTLAGLTSISGYCGFRYDCVAMLGPREVGSSSNHAS
jgi:hypothetical protein